MGLSAPWGRGSQQVSVGLRCGGQGGSQLCLVLCWKWAAPRGQLVWRASVSRAPAGHPGASRQAGDGSDPRGRAAGLSRCLSRAPLCPTHRLTSACPALTASPALASPGPVALAHVLG